MNKAITKWFDSHSSDELNQAFFIFEGLMNVAFSAKSTQFRLLPTEISSCFFDKQKSNIALSTSYRRSFSHSYTKLKYINESHDALFARYYHWKNTLIEDIKKQQNVPLSAKKRKSIQKSMDIREYHLFQEFHFTFAVLMPDQDELFSLKNFVFDVANHMLLVDTLTNGFKNERLNIAARKSIFNQSTSFFENSYPLDFFVHDRYSRHLDSTLKFLITYKDRLSTHIFQTLSQAMSMIDSDYQMLVEI